MLASALFTLTMLATAPATPLGPGDYTRTLMVGGQERSYRLHVPPGYDSRKPTPVVIGLHGLGMTGRIMAWFSGLSDKSDEAGFIAVYPNGTGLGGLVLGWNAGKFQGFQKGGPDDVAFIGKVLDDVELLLNVDRRRVYAVGMSNGGMMAYRLAAEMSSRIAAVASVAGTMAIDECKPTRPVPVLHFHGTEDPLVPIAGPKKDSAKVLGFTSVEDTVRTWARLDGCNSRPVVTTLPMPVDKLKVVRKSYENARGDADVVLYVIEGGGHTWPGMHHHAEFCGDTTDNISATDLIWDFFRRHPLP